MKIRIIIFTLFCGFWSCKEDELSLIPCQSGDKWGYINSEGVILINPQFNRANTFYEGLALVQSAENKFGFINNEGKYVINAIYKDASFFSEGLACVVNENSKPQYIDVNGNIKFSLENADECGVFSEGAAAIKLKDKWGFIDENGKIKINVQFDFVTPFQEGLSAVGKLDIDNKEMLFGFINQKGELVINYQFMSAGRFNNGLAQVYDGKNYGFIDKSGKYIINPQFEFAGEFINSKAIMVQSGMYGFIDMNGNISINPQFKNAGHFSNNGLAPVSSSDGKFGYIDKDGKYLINPQFNGASEFYGNIAFVKSGDKFGLINEKGKYLVNPQYDNIGYEDRTYTYKTIKSDYFDIKNLSDAFLQGTDQENFRRINSKTTLADLKKLFANLSIDNFNWKASVSNPITINESLSIWSIFFEFNDSPILGTTPIYKIEQQYNAERGGYYDAKVIDHYEEISNDNTKLKSVMIYLQLHGNKATSKSDLIFQEIIKDMISKAKLTSSNNPKIFENSNMSITLNGEELSKDFASFVVTFKT